MLYLAERLWWQVQWRHWDVWLCFLYTEVSRVLLGLWETKVSKKGMDLMKLYEIWHGKNLSMLAKLILLLQCKESSYCTGSETE